MAGPGRPRPGAAAVKRLLLLRHAKSSWDDSGIADHERPLAPRGERAAAAVAAYLAQRGAAPDLVLCSTAVRARQTLERMLAALPGRPEVRTTRELYLAEPERILGLVQGVDDGAAGLLVVGHNPGLGELAASLAGTGDAKPLARLRERFPTFAVAVLEFDVASWRDVAPGGGRLAGFATPKDLV